MQTFTPLEYLKIDVATNFGLDKENWDVRIQWTDDNIDRILDMLQTIDTSLGQKGHPLLKKAEEPALFYAGCKALRDALNNKPVSYPISLDATASGAQLMALLMKCDKSAALCNVTNSPDRIDFYTAVHGLYNDEAGETLSRTRQEMKDAVNH